MSNQDDPYYKESYLSGLKGEKPGFVRIFHSAEEKKAMDAGYQDGMHRRAVLQQEAEILRKKD